MRQKRTQFVRCGECGRKILLHDGSESREIKDHVKPCFNRLGPLDAVGSLLGLGLIFTLGLLFGGVRDLVGGRNA